MTTQNMINRLIRETGIYVSKNRLYHYEEYGIVKGAKRTSSDYREWTEADYKVLKLVVLMADLGVPLKVILKYTNANSKDELAKLLLRKEAGLGEVLAIVNGR